MARYALIIGIAEYTTASFQSLESPVQNANAIAEILDRVGDFNQVRRLPFRREAGQKDLGKVIRKPLSNETLVRELQQFLHDADGSDVLLYYSGHGFTKLDPLSQTLEGYLAPSDCQVELNAAGQVRAEKNGISLYGLNALINRHKFNSLVVILDCCNAGAFLESGMVRRDVTAFWYQRDYYLITACRSSSKAYEGEEYSLLTAAVLKGLSPASATAGSGRISGDRLFDVVGEELQNSRQEPLRMGWGRSITLVRYEQQQAMPTLESTFNPANPYMGLRAFEQKQSDYFFGREQAVRALLDRLAENRFLAVIGPSGCGKSSLVKAGLLPELAGDRLPGSHDWQVEIITPGQYPLQVLTNALERHHADKQPVVLFIDQFEELFTLCLNEDEQRTFIKRLNEETNDPAKQTRIIVAMRGDFLDRCAKFQEAADLINSTAPTTYMVIPLTEAKLVGDLKESITCPADLHGVTFEPGLVSRIVDDVVNQPGAMPLLQYALLQLWNHCITAAGDSRLLTLQSYNAIDGVKGALQRWADQFYTNLSPTDQAFVQELISELVQIGDGNEVTRRRATWERLRSIASQAQLDRIIGRLIYQRLLVADDNTVEVAHEALLSESKLIQGWIEENREGIRLQQRLEIYRHEWQEHDRSENYLLDAGRLAAIDEWIERKQPRLMPIDQEFIGKSRERRDRQFQAELEQERRLREEAVRRELAEIEKKIEAEERAKEALGRAKAEKRIKNISLLASMLVITSLSLGSLVYIRQIQLDEGKRSKAKSLVDNIERLLEKHNELEALTASVETIKELNKMEWTDLNDLIKIKSLVSKVRKRNEFKAHETDVSSIGFSQGGSTLVSGGDDGTIRIWNLETNQILPTVSAHQDVITSVEFSPDNKTFVSASTDGSVKLWTSQGKIKHNLPFNKREPIFSVSFSSDGKLLAASGENGNIFLWDLSSNPKFIGSFFAGLNGRKRKRIYSLDFHPKSKSILISTGLGDYDVAVWDLKRREIKPLRIGNVKGSSFLVKFNHEGNIIASLEGRGRIEIRDFETLKTIGRITNKDNISHFDFSSDDSLIVSASTSGNIQAWSINEAISKWRDGRKRELKDSIEAYKIYSPSAYSVNFRPNLKKLNITESQLLASANYNGYIEIWDMSNDIERSISIEKKMGFDKLSSLICAKISSYLIIQDSLKKVRDSKKSPLCN